MRSDRILRSLIGSAYRQRIFALILTSLSSSAALAQTPGDPALGERLYRTGLGADGQPVTAITQGDVRIAGDQLTCVSCHRPSGMGTSEGGTYVPPITANHLFAAREANRALRNERFKEMYKEVQTERFYQDVRKARLRPAYTPETLARALREGLDPAGRALNPAMPRYELSDADAADIAAYLATLSKGDDPGVEPDTVHFATIVSDGIDATRADAFVKTIEAYAEWFNRDIRDDLARPGFSPYYRDEFLDSYREWRVHVWRLAGPPEGWPAQLARYYEEQPVFAVLSGLVAGDFTPIADFCDAKHVPCLFPVTELPRTERATGGYTLYFSRGLELEADALAAWLTAQEAPPAHVTVIHSADAYGRRPAARLAAALAARRPGLAIELHEVSDAAAMRAAIGDAAGKEDNTLVIWPGHLAAAATAALAESPPAASHVFLPSAALEAARALPAAVRDRVLVTYPYDKPERIRPDAYRARAWIRSRRLPIVNWNDQREAYFALRMTDWAMAHLLSDYHRDYLIEIIEHEVENSLDPGPQPQMALGPGQRFGSKGAFIMRLDPDAPSGLVAVGDWIVP